MATVRELVTKFVFKGNTKPLDDLAKAFDKAKDKAGKANDSFAKGEKGLGGLAHSIKALPLKNLAIGLGAATVAVGTFVGGMALAAKTIFETRDELVLLKAGLQTFGMSAKDAGSSVEFLLELSNRTGQSFEALGSTYRAVTLQSKKLGLGLKDTKKLTEAVALANMMGGASAEAQAGAMLQFGQLLGGAKVQAQEFNSLIDGMPYLLDLVGKEMHGAAGGVSSLTQAVKSKEGVAVDDFVKGILGASEKLRREQEKMPPVLARVNNKFQNLRITAALALEGQVRGSESLLYALDKLVDKIAEFIEENKALIATGIDAFLMVAKVAVDAMSGAIDFLTKHFEKIVGVATMLAGAFSAMAIALVVGLIPATWAHVTALLAQVAAMLAASPAIALYAVIGAALAGLAYLAYRNRDALVDMAKKAMAVLKPLYQNYIKPLVDGMYGVVAATLRAGAALGSLGGIKAGGKLPTNGGAQGQVARKTAAVTNNAKVSASFSISGAGDPKAVASSVMNALDSHVFSAFQNIGANA